MPGLSVPSPALRQEAWRIVWRALAGVVAGLWSQSWSVGALVFLALYLVLHLRSLLRLRAWLRRPKRTELPEARGLWGEIFDELYNLQRRNRKRKKRLSSILAEFQASTAALPYGTVVLGHNGEIAWFNDAAQLLLGLRTGQDIGQRIVNLVRHPNFTEYFTQVKYERDVDVPSPVNPAMVLALRIVPYGRGQRLLIVRDVSELRRLEMARRDFVANASHELRTPLTVLRGYLDVMVPDAGDGGTLSDWRSPLLEMRTQVMRMQALVDDMLRLARLEADAGPMHQPRLDVPRMLEATQGEAQTLWHGRHRLEFDIEAGLDLIGRESELHSVFANLVGNAIQYTPEGGSITVRWWSDGQGAHFSVADTGIGIAEKDIPRITERFYRVDVDRSRAGGGTGLGLAIVRHALERHEGRLQIESKLGVGSTFTCHFPPQRVRHRAPAAPASSSG